MQQHIYAVFWPDYGGKASSPYLFTRLFTPTQCQMRQHE